MGVLKTWKKRRNQKQLDKGIQFFLEGKYDKVAKLFEDFKQERGGDVAAIQLLMAAEDDGIEHLRALYGGLWEAKRCRFTNEQLGCVVDAKLETVTPIVMKHAEDEIRRIHQHYLEGNKEAVFSGCEKHVAYGHPDALALQITGYLDFGCGLDDFYYRERYLYGEWCYDLKNAKLKGFSKEIEALAETTLARLEYLALPEIFSDPSGGFPWGTDNFGPAGWE